MSADVLAGLDRLVASRRRQVAAAIDGLEATRALAEVVQVQAARHDIPTIERLLATAPDEETRGLWQSLINRARQPVPSLIEKGPT